MSGEIESNDLLPEPAPYRRTPGKQMSDKHECPSCNNTRPAYDTCQDLYHLEESSLGTTPQAKQVEQPKWRDICPGCMHSAARHRRTGGCRSCDCIQSSPLYAPTPPLAPGGEVETTSSAVILGEQFDKAPDGWWCSRARGHDGPCAVTTVMPIEIEASIIAQRAVDAGWSRDDNKANAALVEITNAITALFAARQQTAEEARREGRKEQAELELLRLTGDYQRAQQRFEADIAALAQRRADGGGNGN